MFLTHAYGLLYTHHTQFNNTLPTTQDVCKYSHAVFNTKTIQADKAEYTKALEQVVVYLVLSPYDNEQSDLVARVAVEEKLKDCKAHKDLLEGFINQEIM